MKYLSNNYYKKNIKHFFKELIFRYKSNGYKENIVPISSKDKLPVFQLRFIKKGNSCVYYRIVLSDNEIK